jgi:hypothetical protein
VKICTQCGEQKPYTEFAAHKVLGIRPNCKRCARSKHIERLYGITIDDYEKMYEDQKGLCALCGSGEVATLNGNVTRLCIDHDHGTGEVRGLLCRGCNHLLDAIEVKPADWLLKAHDYLFGGE